MLWLKFIWNTLVEFFRLLKSGRVKKLQQQEEVRRRREERARRATENINDAVDDVVRPKLDSNPNSDDPMGVDHWNRGR